ncbi:glycopeptide [Phanerochaete sordida]|uniref:Glycopeptide n=1 Tax=Phanerochaete sordida TaxID=48140 RepID=A0A9P3LJQ7_9APHY|nr:glycopeptide [Phanerochaete sordida]
MGPGTVLPMLLFACSAAAQTSTELHMIQFVNNCGFGTPLLKASTNNITISMGEAVTISGPLVDAVAFLQTGSCGDAGEGCTAVSITLRNPTSPGDGSSVVILEAPPYAFSVATGFGYFNGCDGAGQDCTFPGCPDPGCLPGHCPEPTDCEADNVNLAVTFCD